MNPREFEERRQRPFPAQSWGLGQSPASADNKRLAQELEKAVASVAKLCQLEGLATGEDDLPKDFEALRHRANGPAGQNARQIERDCALIQTLRQEIANRSQRKVEHRKRQRSAARKSLQKILADAPAVDAELRERAEAVAESWRVIADIVQALEAVAGAADFANKHGLFRDGVHEAAAALGVEPPELSPLPELPTKVEIQDGLAALRGRGGYSKLKVNLGGADKARKHADTLKRG